MTSSPKRRRIDDNSSTTMEASSASTRRRQVPDMNPEERTAAIERRRMFDGFKLRGKTFASLQALSILSILSLTFVEVPDGASAQETAAQTEKLCTFLCLLCGHLFNAFGYSVIGRGQTCPFCCNAPQKICPKSEKCELCVSRSLAAPDVVTDLEKKSVKYDVYRNVRPACEVSRSSDKKRYWLCYKKGCGHSFEATPLDITRTKTKTDESGETSKEHRGTACPYCCVGSEKFCPVSENCQSCIAKSHASPALIYEIKDRAIPVAGYILADGTRKPLAETAPQCNKKCQYICPTVPDHGEFYARAGHVVGVMKSGCPKCVNKSEHAMLSFLETTLAEITGCTWQRGEKLPTAGICRYDEIIRFEPGDAAAVEIDGAPHFVECTFGSHITDPNVQRGVDVKKTNAALEHGASVVRIATHGSNRVVGGKRLQRLGGALIEAVRALATREPGSAPVVVCIDLDSPGCYEPFKAHEDLSFSFE